MTWLNLVQLSKLPTFGGILDQVEKTFILLKLQFFLKTFLVVKSWRNSVKLNCYWIEN